MLRHETGNRTGNIVMLSRRCIFKECRYMRDSLPVAYVFVTIHPQLLENVGSVYAIFNGHPSLRVSCHRPAAAKATTAAEKKHGGEERGTNRCERSRAVGMRCRKQRRTADASFPALRHPSCYPTLALVFHSPHPRQSNVTFLTFELVRSQ